MMIVPDTSCSTEQGTLSAVNSETCTADSGRSTEYPRELFCKLPKRIECRKPWEKSQSSES